MEATNASARQAMWANAVKVMSMSVCQTLVILGGRTIAFNSPTAIAANAVLDIQVLTCFQHHITAICLFVVSKCSPEYMTHTFFFVYQVSAVTRCLMAAKGDPAEMEGRVL